MVAEITTLRLLLWCLPPKRATQDKTIVVKVEEEEEGYVFLIEIIRRRVEREIGQGKMGTKYPMQKEQIVVSSSSFLGSKKRKFLSFFAVMDNLLCIGLAIYVFRPLKGTGRKSHVPLMEVAQSNGKNLMDTAIYGYWDL
ncbi:hypothetical protein Tco_0775456, partial [Tanacetum coccineum]